MPVSTDAVLAPSTPDAVAAAFSADTDGAVTVASLSPFRISPELWPIWGFQISTSFDSDTEVLTLGAAFRADWFHLLAGVLTRDYAVVSSSPTVLAELGRQARIYATNVRRQAGTVSDSGSGAVFCTNGDAANRGAADVAAGIRTQYPDDSPERRAVLTAAAEVQAAFATQSTRFSCPTGPTPGPDGSLPDHEAAVEELVTKLDVLVDALLALAAREPEREPVDALDEPAEAMRRVLVRRSHGHAIAFIPALTIGYVAGFFPAAIERATGSVPAVGDWRADESHAFTAQAFWRAQPWVELQLEFAYRQRRSAGVEDTTTMASELAFTEGVALSAAALVVIPELLGARAYDNYYFEERFQRGVGLGASFTYNACLATGDSRANCPKGRLTRLSAGGVVDVRIATEARLRIRAGYLRIETFDLAMASGQGADGVELAGTFVVSVE